MGLSLETFLNLTPSAFNATYKVYEENEKQKWSIAAWTAFKTVCPGSGKQFSFTDFLPPWLVEKTETTTLNDEDALQRYEKLKVKWDK